MEPFRDRCNDDLVANEELGIKSAFMRCQNDELYISMWTDTHCDGRPFYTVAMTNGKCEKVWGHEHQYVKCWW